MGTSLIADSTAPPSDVHQTPYHIQVRQKAGGCDMKSGLAPIDFNCSPVCLISSELACCTCRQVLVLGCTPDLALTEAAIRSAADAALPAACSRAVHLVDACRCGCIRLQVSSLSTNGQHAYPLQTCMSLCAFELFPCFLADADRCDSDNGSA